MRGDKKKEALMNLEIALAVVSILAGTVQLVLLIEKLIEALL